MCTGEAPRTHYVLDVELLDSVPLVTRRIVVSGKRTLGELHRILQVSMGWEDCHLHVFEARDRSWRVADPDYGVEGVDDEWELTLDEVAPRKGSRFLYEYDFGDSWVHEIRVVERMDPDDAAPEPRCVGGQNACPPEDSGGPPGYAWKLEVLGDPEDPDYDDVVEWMGEDYDAAAFDVDRVNTRLAAFAMES